MNPLKLLSSRFNSAIIRASADENHLKIRDRIFNFFTAIKEEIKALFQIHAPCKKAYVISFDAKFSFDLPQLGLSYVLTRFNQMTRVNGILNRCDSFFWISK